MIYDSRFKIHMSINQDDSFRLSFDPFLAWKTLVTVCMQVYIFEVTTAYIRLNLIVVYYICGY